MNGFVVTVIAVPAVVIALTVTYQVGDYLDPTPLVPNHTESRHERARYEESHQARAELPFGMKVGRGMKQGVALLVAVPLGCAFLIWIFSGPDGKRKRRDDYYGGDGG